MGMKFELHFRATLYIFFDLEIGKGVLIAFQMRRDDLFILNVDVRADGCSSINI
jgi:hypothetical protein